MLLLLAALVSVRAYDLTLAVISNNRLSSLRRLCASLSRLENPEGIVAHLSFNLEASSSTELLDFVYSFEWPHGHKHIKKRVQQGGLITAVMESWYPSSNQNYGMFLEDDVEVSPLALRWVHHMLSLYQSGEFRSSLSERIIGIALYSPRVTETSTPKEAFNSTEMSELATGIPSYPYLMQTPCSWGAVYFPRPWRLFVDYLDDMARSSVSSGPAVTKLNTAQALQAALSVHVPRSSTNGWKGNVCLNDPSMDQSA